MTHKDKYKRFVDDEKKREERTKKIGNGVELQQTTLESIVERRKSYSADHPKAKAISNRLADMMDTNLQPFSIVSDVGFCCLLAELSLGIRMFCQVVDIFQKFLYQKCMQKSSKEFQRF